MSIGATDRLLRPVRRSVEMAIVALFTALTIAVFVQFVARYVFNQPPAWTEELARYCQVWVVLLASSLCIRRGSHLAVDYLGPTLRAPVRRILAVAIGALMVLYACVVAVWGVRLMIVGFQQVSPAMQVNMGIVYVIFPLAGALMALEATLASVRQARTEERT